MLRKIDDFLNNMTMYRLLTYGLGLLAAVSLAFGLAGVLSIKPAGMLLSLILLIVGCYGMNKLMAIIWDIPANNESWLITALILFFILPQATTLQRGIYILLAGAIAMASKYIINWQGKHLFNPAAFAAASLGFFGFGGLLGTTWWVGSSVLWPFTLVLGLLVVRKIHRFPLLLSFVLVSLITIVIVALTRDGSVVDALKTSFSSSPLIFLGTIMLTEPSTMPPIRRQQLLFGAVVGLLYAGQFHFGSFYIYPTMALLIGNMYAFTVSPKYRLRLTLKEVQKISDRVYNYVFTSDASHRPLAYQPGQYLEWTISGVKFDSRGNRRTFTIASSPTESTIQLGVKFYQPSSNFKQALKALKPGSHIYAGQLAGNFTLPSDPTKKLVFIAGGIGITPFRSMVKYLVDNGQKRDIKLFYFVSDQTEIAYADVWQQAKANGIDVIPVINGKLDEAFVKTSIPDHAQRSFYLSGPQLMIEGYRATLRKIGIPIRQIEADYFSGY